MEALEMISSRRSIRRYLPGVVAREKLEEIMETARFTQSWGNAQTVRFTFVQQRELIEKMMYDGVNGFVYNMKPLEKAENVLVLSFKTGTNSKGVSSENAWEVFDAGIACQTFCLTAHAHGLGTCVMGVIDDKIIGDIVGLPDGETVGSVITFGYPDEDGTPPKRLEVDELCRFL